VGPTVELTAEEWEWFKRLPRLEPHERALPAPVGRRLLELRLLEQQGPGALIVTAHGRAVLRLVEGQRSRWRGGKKGRPPKAE
jgi:hypothetical protein